MKHQNYIVIRASGSNPDPATYCPANGYYDPTLPIPYIPDAAIPEIVPNDGEIVLFMSTMWDAAINCTTTRTGATGQIRYTIYGENDEQIYTQDVNSGTVFFYEFPATGGILLADGYYGFKVVIKVATAGTLNTFRFNTKTGYAVNGWPVIEAHIKATTLTSLYYAFDSQKSIKYIKFYGDHNDLTNLQNFASNCSDLVECHSNVSMNALTSMYNAYSNTPKLEILTLAESYPALTNMQTAFANCGLKSSPQLPNTLPECTNASQTFGLMQRLSGILYVPDMPKCTDLVYIASSLPLIKKVVFRGSYVPNGLVAISICANNPLMEELDMSAGTWGKIGNTWGMTYIVSNCPSLKIIKMPISCISLDSGISPSNQPAQNITNNVLTEITECDFSNSPGIHTFLYFPKLKNYYQPTLDCNSRSLSCNGSLSRPFLLETLELNWSNCLPQTASVVISCLYCNFSQTELERIYTAMPDISTGYSYTGTLKFYGSPGYAASDKTIATAKGWIFATS